MKIRGFLLTRDSWIWFWTKVVGLATLVTTGIIDPKGLGLSDIAVHWVMVAAAVVLWFGGQQSASALPSKVDADKVTLPVKETP